MLQVVPMFISGVKQEAPQRSYRPFQLTCSCSIATVPTLNCGPCPPRKLLEHPDAQIYRMSGRKSLAWLIAKGKTRPGWLLGPPGPSREETLKAVEEHTKKHRGLRQGWQVKAATWVKKVHMSRGHVEVGAWKPGSSQFVVDDNCRPRYIVPDLTKTELRAYVAAYDPEEVKKQLAASGKQHQAKSSA